MDHEYVVLGGTNRAQVGRYLTRTASVVSGILVWALLQVVDVAKGLGLGVNLPPVFLSLLGAGTVYAGLYLLFRKWVWRLPWIMRWLKVANLAGTWVCEGSPFPRPDSKAIAWKAAVTITQDWDRFRVHLKTAKSASNSIVAALTTDPIEGYVLLYSYQNEPKPEDGQLSVHRGFARLVFAKDLQRAEGDYFNGDGRHSSGSMILRRS
ncbi:hypothetical protein C8J98_10673 [Luteibacter sp. OK325]|uniref:Cap15 family cyclic dinucleotide receptor domain-containing protein n=1 Tax=Luteibacter sp. OK325 TaxID=2135670 RepID=UPI000D38BE2E|nr:hypothetical protein [Luteibacter sp. OK325]PTR30762.1 hypothetical protein C8J98_10673 [Luteibacter sp. OK325]